MKNMCSSNSWTDVEYPHYCPPYPRYIEKMRMLGIEGRQITPENFWKTLVHLTIFLMVNANHLRLYFGENKGLVEKFLNIFHKEPVFQRYRFKTEQDNKGRYRVFLYLTKKVFFKRGSEVPRERVIQFLRFLLENAGDEEIKFSPGILDYLVILAVHFENWWLMEVALNKGANFHVINFNETLTTQIFGKTSHITLILSPEYFNTVEEYADISRKYTGTLPRGMSDGIVRWCYTFKEKVFEELCRHLLSDLAKFVLGFL